MTTGAALYTRISESDQSQFSMDAQIEACRVFAARQGLEVVAEYVEKGQSAGSDQRPAFQEMIAAAKAGKFQAIIVHKLDRFARSREDSVVYKALLRRVGVRVLSVSEPMAADDGPIGRLVEGILEVVADWFLANLRQETTKGMRRMAESGLWPSRPPLGYDRAADKRLCPVQPWSAWLNTAFAEFASGRYTLEAWGNEAHARGMRERSGARISTARWSTILNNRIYTGVIPYAGEIYPGRHAALTDQATFDAVQAVLDQRNGKRKRQRASGQERRQFLLAGLLWSQDADCAMHGASAKSGRYCYYISARDAGAGKHRVSCDTLEGQIPAILENVTVDHAAITGLVLGDQVKFGLRVASNVGSVYDGLERPADRRALVVAALERLEVADRGIVIVKVRSPFAPTSAVLGAARFEREKYPLANINAEPSKGAVFATLRPPTRANLWSFAG